MDRAWRAPVNLRSRNRDGPPCQTTGAVAKTLGHGASLTVHPATPTRKKLIQFDLAGDVRFEE